MWHEQKPCRVCPVCAARPWHELIALTAYAWQLGLKGEFLLWGFLAGRVEWEGLPESAQEMLTYLVREGWMSP